jgi:hypothetical protein
MKNQLTKHQKNLLNQKMAANELKLPVIHCALKLEILKCLNQRTPKNFDMQITFSKVVVYRTIFV